MIEFNFTVVDKDWYNDVRKYQYVIFKLIPISREEYNKRKREDSINKNRKYKELKSDELEIVYFKRRGIKV